MLFIIFSALEITLKGCTSNVKQVSTKIKELLFEMNEAVTLSKQVLWNWTDAETDILNPLPLRVSRAIEKAYEVTMSLS